MRVVANKVAVPFAVVVLKGKPSGVRDARVTPEPLAASETAVAAPRVVKRDALSLWYLEERE